MKLSLDRYLKELMKIVLIMLFLLKSGIVKIHLLIQHLIQTENI